MRVFPFVFNGLNWDRPFICPNAVAVSVATTTRTQIIALSGSTNIRVCKIFLTPASAVDISFQSGTDSNCGTGTAAVGGTFTAVTSLTLDHDPESALRFGASNAACITLGAAVAVTGTIMYAQF
jgi:hypothetical protein